MKYKALHGQNDVDLNEKMEQAKKDGFEVCRATFRVVATNSGAQLYVLVCKE